MAVARTSGVAAGTMDGGVRRDLTVPDKAVDGPGRERRAWQRERWTEAFVVA